MTAPLVSVMMPARNEELYIAEAIESIMAQDHSNLELIIVDDGSTDRTHEIATDWARKDSRITVIVGEAVCSGNARNKAIDAAQGDYIMNMDADDFSVPHRISALLRMAASHEHVVVGSNMSFVDQSLRPIRTTDRALDNTAIRKQLGKLWGRNALTAGTCLFSAPLLRQYRYNEFYKVLVDWDLILRLFEDPRVVFMNAPEPLYLYRINQGSMSTKVQPRVRYSLLLRYNEMQRRRKLPEIRDLEEFEALVRKGLLSRWVYRLIYGVRWVQYTRLARKWKQTCRVAD